MICKVQITGKEKLVCARKLFLTRSVGCKMHVKRRKMKKRQDTKLKCVMLSTKGIKKARKDFNMLESEFKSMVRSAKYI